MIFQKKQSPTLLSLHRIWNDADSNQMPHLIYFKDNWLCALRESSAENNHGSIRIIWSQKHKKWTSTYFLSDPTINFFNPQLSITPNDHLMLLAEGVTNEKDGSLVHQSYVAFSEDGFVWSSLQSILEPGQWIWNLIWHRCKAFALSGSKNYQNKEDQSKQVDFLYSQNGIDYLWVTSLNIPSNPKDGALAFHKDRAIGLFRRDKKNDSYAILGVSTFPFYHWDWQACQYPIGDPILINTPEDQLWAAGCLFSPTPYGFIEKIVLMRVHLNALLEPVLILPSGGQMGNPSLLYHNQELWLCYASSHEGKSGIYLAQINLPTRL